MVQYLIELGSQAYQLRRQLNNIIV